MSVKEYRTTRFTAKSRPAINTIKKWVDNGDINGEVIGGMYYVEPDIKKPVNHLVNKVIQ